MKAPDEPVMSNTTIGYTWTAAALRYARVVHAHKGARHHVLTIADTASSAAAHDPRGLALAKRPYLLTDHPADRLR